MKVFEVIKNSQNLELMNFTEVPDEDVLLDVLKGDYTLAFNGVPLYDESLDTLPIESTSIGQDSLLSEGDLKRMISHCHNMATEDGMYDVREKVLYTTIQFEFVGGAYEVYTFKVTPLSIRRRFTMIAVKQKKLESSSMIDICGLLHKRVYG